MRSKIAYLIFIAVLGALAYIGVQADQKSFVGSLFAAFLSAFIVFFVEMELRPAISIAQEGTPVVQPDGRRFLRVVVANRALWWPLKLIMDRRPANQVRAWITFLTEANNPVFAPGRQMIGRWSNTPEPVRPMMISQNPGGAPEMTLLLDPTVTRDAVDIGSGASEVLDIVMRGPREAGCRGWHNRIIQHPNPRPEDRFELPMGRYHAQVRVDVSGRSSKALFRIVCDVGIEDFRLEPL
jgi:hypothetical protein